MTSSSARQPSRPPLRIRREEVCPEPPDQPAITVRSESMTIEACAAAAPGWRIAAAVYGVPWLVIVGVGSFWYLGWGAPSGFGTRLMIWVVLMAFTIALHALALMTFWGTAYAKSGIETLTIDPDRITIRRQAGHIPIEMYIRRGIVEGAEAVPPRSDGRPNPRIEVKSWRSALRFGAGMTAEQAEECLYVLKAFFDREEYVRDALTPPAPEATIAPTQAGTLVRSMSAMTGTSRSGDDQEKRAGTVRARVARWTRRSPRSLGPNGPRGVK